MLFLVVTATTSSEDTKPALVGPADRSDPEFIAESARVQKEEAASRNAKLDRDQRRAHKKQTGSALVLLAFGIFAAFGLGLFITIITIGFQSTLAAAPGGQVVFGQIWSGMSGYVDPGLALAATTIILAFIAAISRESFTRRQEWDNPVDRRRQRYAQEELTRVIIYSAVAAVVMASFLWANVESKADTGASVVVSMLAGLVVISAVHSTRLVVDDIDRKEAIEKLNDETVCLDRERNRLVRWIGPLENPTRIRLWARGARGYSKLFTILFIVNTVTITMGGLLVWVFGGDAQYVGGQDWMGVPFLSVVTTLIVINASVGKVQKRMIFSESTSYRLQVWAGVMMRAYSGLFAMLVVLVSFAFKGLISAGIASACIIVSWVGFSMMLRIDRPAPSALARNLLRPIWNSVDAALLKDLRRVEKNQIEVSGELSESGRSH